MWVLFLFWVVFVIWGVEVYSLEDKGFFCVEYILFVFVRIGGGIMFFMGNKGCFVFSFIYRLFWWFFYNCLGVMVGDVVWVRGR